MRTRKIGSLEVSAVGLGCMGFSHGYGPGVKRGRGDRLDAVSVSTSGAPSTTRPRATPPVTTSDSSVGPWRRSADQVVIATKFRVDDSASVSGGEWADYRLDVTSRTAAPMSAADPSDQSSAARATASAAVRQIVVDSSQRPVNVAAPGADRPISLVSNPQCRLGERSPCIVDRRRLGGSSGWRR